MSESETKFDDGGPVHPRDTFGEFVSNGDGAYVQQRGSVPGMSLWAWFAGQALTHTLEYRLEDWDVMVRHCAKVADAMIAEMRRREGGK